MKIGVIGAGTMGSESHRHLQTEGYEVVLCDINEEFAANGKKKIAKGFEKRIAKGKMTQEDADKIAQRSSYSAIRISAAIAIWLMEVTLRTWRSRNRPSRS